MRKPISAIEEIDCYISKFQRSSKNGKKGSYRIVEDEAGCWVWKAAKSATKREILSRKVAYGRMALDENLCDWLGIEGRIGKHIRPHVLIYHVHVEDLNDRWDQIANNEIEIAHKCGNSLCCRPDHLYATDRETNAQDRVEHRRESDKQNADQLKELGWWRATGKKLGISYSDRDE